VVKGLRRGAAWDSTRKGRGPHFTDTAFRVLEVVQALTHEHGATSSQVALAWVAQPPGVTSPIIGPRTLAQLEDCLGAVHVRLTAEDRKRLDAVASPGQAIVPYYEADFGPHRFRWSCEEPLALPPHASVGEANALRLARRLTTILPATTLAGAIESPYSPALLAARWALSLVCTTLFPTRDARRTLKRWVTTCEAVPISRSGFRPCPVDGRY
jgi:hypothetical protein